MAKKKKPTNKKADKVNDVTQKLNDIVVKQEKEQKEKKPVLKVQDLLDKLPKDTRVNHRKDGFVKLFEGNVYLRNVSYGIQMVENNRGAPGKVILAIKTQDDLKTTVTQIEENIKNYNPEHKKRELKPDSEVFVGIKYKTRERMKQLKTDSIDTYEKLISKALDLLEK